MHVVCKDCGEVIAVAGRPKGSTNAQNVQTDGPVNLGDGGISFGPGGGISFGSGGSLSFGPPPASTFICRSCGHSSSYEASEILD